MTVPWRKDAPRMTAADVEAIEFPRTPWGRRGYDEAAVDVFQSGVRDELRACANDVTGLLEEVMRLKARFVASQRGNPDEWLADASEAHAMAVAIVSEAQVTADRYVTDAQEYAGRITGTAEEQREQMLAEAARALADARTQARQAALTALDEPVPGETAGALRAARADAAWQGTFGRVSRRHALAAVQLAVHILQDWEDHEAGDGQAPAMQDIHATRKDTP